MSVALSTAEKTMQCKEQMLVIPLQLQGTTTRQTTKNKIHGRVCLIKCLGTTGIDVRRFLENKIKEQMEENK